MSKGADEPDLGSLRCFVAGAGQGVNYARGTWHHPLLVLEGPAEFMVLDRHGPGGNYDEVRLPSDALWIGVPLD